MKLQVIKNRILYWLKTITVFSLYIGLILTITSFFVIQLPAVQSKLTQRYLKSFSNITDFKTSVKRVEVYWFDRVLVEGVSIQDPEDNTMISIHKLMLNFKFSELFADKNISLDAVTIDSAKVYLKTISTSDTTRDLNINLFVQRINEMGGSGAGGGGTVTIGEALLHNSSFKYSTDQDSITNRFDHNHFSLKIPEIELQNFLALGDTIEFNVRSLTATEDRTNLTIHQLTTFFRISQASMEFTGIQAKVGESTISDTVHFFYNSQLDLSNFVHAVNVYANFSNTSIHPKDLALFAPIPEGISGTINLSGEFTGRIDKFRFRNMDIQLGTTRLSGSMDMDGLPDINETFILLNLRQSTIDFTDLSFLFNEKIIARLEPLGMLRFRGQFLGYPTDFVANGDFYSDIGRINSDINFKVNENAFDQSEYKGRLTLNEFDIGMYLSDTVNFQKTSVSGEIHGKGLTAQTADFTLNGKINSIGIRRYNYSNIITNARFASQFFSGKVSVDDPNLKFIGAGSIDFRNKQNKINIEAILDTAVLHQLNISKEELTLKTEMRIALQGLVLDSLLGRADLKDSYVTYRGKDLALDNLTLQADKDEHRRQINLRTPLFDFDVAGNFYFSNLFKDAQNLLTEFLLNLKNNKDDIERYYTNKKNNSSQYTANFLCHINDIKPLSDLLSLPFFASNNTIIDGHFTMGSVVTFQASTFIDTLAYLNTSLFKTNVEIHASKYKDSTDVLAMAYINSRQQRFSTIKTQNLVSESIWDENHINTWINIEQQQTDNKIRLSGTVDFLDSTRIKLLPSTIHLLEKDWLVEKQNILKIHKNSWTFENFGFLQENQSILLNGSISPDSLQTLFLDIQNFNLSNINPIILRQLNGTMNAKVKLNNYYGIPHLENTLLVKNLKVDDFLIGDITGNNLWDTDARKFKLEFFVDRLENRIVNCEGYYNPTDSKSPINLTARFNQANLKIFEPFIDDLFSQFQGTLTGGYQVGGTLAEPWLNGEGRIENGGMMINYLKTVYQFNGILGLSKESIYFKNIELLDLFKNKGKLEGSITHKNFAQMFINLDGQFEDFQVLNTTSKDNSLFYGQGYASGNVNIMGPINNLKITSTATTRKNTRIYIPISGGSSTEQKDFINFVNFKDSTYIASQTIEEKGRINLTGVTVDFNLDVTPDAYCEIIFDLKAGDIIRGRGFGKIKLQLDTKGEFNMFGPVEFTQGWYNFTLYDLINKEFEIKPGSSISWYGDPYQGVMKIDASYNQLASLAPILSDQSLATAPQIKRKYPVQVLLKLDGQMLAPTINFDIVAKDLPKSVNVEGRPPVLLDIEFAAFKNKLDEQELKRQVFSLIILRRFSPPESFNTSGSLVGSVSELFSNQLSYWLSQVDENLEIDVDLGNMDQETFNAFQLRMSYTFMNGRLRVTRDGTLGNQTTSTTTSTTETRNDLAMAIGDWTVDYLLSADGKFKVKMYSRSNVNPLVNSVNTQSTFTTGVSLMYTQSFNEFKDLLRQSRDKNRKDDSPELDDQNKDGTKEEDDGG